MAASDLQGELAKDSFQVEGDSERRLVQVVLQQLEDPSGDIQNLAVKWYPFHRLFSRKGMPLVLTSTPQSASAKVGKGGSAIAVCQARLLIHELQSVLRSNHCAFAR